MYEVRDSPIHGKGLFATEPIRKGQLIGRFKGTRVRGNLDSFDVDGMVDGMLRANGTLSPRLHRRVLRYLMSTADHTLWLDGSSPLYVQNDLRYANHSSEPNAAAYDCELWALRPIGRGKEITFHYGADWEDG